MRQDHKLDKGAKQGEIISSLAISTNLKTLIFEIYDSRVIFLNEFPVGIYYNFLLFAYLNYENLLYNSMYQD